MARFPRLHCSFHPVFLISWMSSELNVGVILFLLSLPPTFPCYCIAPLPFASPMGLFCSLPTIPHDASFFFIDPIVAFPLPKQILLFLPRFFFPPRFLFFGCLLPATIQSPLLFSFPTPESRVVLFYSLPPRSFFLRLAGGPLFCRIIGSHLFHFPLPSYCQASLLPLPHPGGGRTINPPSLSSHAAAPGFLVPFFRFR